jgi:hypothetical protein
VRQTTVFEPTAIPSSVAACVAAPRGRRRLTRAAYLEHEQAKTELKGLMPEDAKEAIGHGVRAKRSKSGAVSFDLLVQEGSHAAFE